MLFLQQTGGKMNQLSKCLLFENMNEKDIQEALSCFHSYTKSYQKNETIYHTGEHIHCLGIVLEGLVQIENNDVWGNHSLLNHIYPYQVFGETYAYLDEALRVDIIALQKSEILFLDLKQIHSHPECVHHQKIIQNLLSITMESNLNLSRRMIHTSSKTIRSRLLSYLSDEAIIQKNNHFSIPYNRQQLADYLAVDRSALSHELSQMKKEGLIDYHKNHFHLKV